MGQPALAARGRAARAAIVAMNGQGGPTILARTRPITVSQPAISLSANAISLTLTPRGYLSKSRKTGSSFLALM